MSISRLSFALLLLSAHLDSIVLLSSEDGAHHDFYTARFPNGQNYTYHTGKGHAWSYWNGTTAEDDILEGHNAARRELNLSALERSPNLVKFATEHAQLCGNSTEPDIYSVLPRFEGMSLTVNIWELVDPTMIATFTQIGENFYSVNAKEEYRNGYTLSNHSSSDNIYGLSYHQFHAYHQVIRPDLRHIGCYGRRCDPISNPQRTSPQKYLSIRYVHWTYVVCYYDNNSSVTNLSLETTTDSKSVEKTIPLSTGLSVSHPTTSPLSTTDSELLRVSLSTSSLLTTTEHPLTHSTTSLLPSFGTRLLHLRPISSSLSPFTTINGLPLSHPSSPPPPSMSRGLPSDLPRPTVASVLTSTRLLLPPSTTLTPTTSTGLDLALPHPSTSLAGQHSLSLPSQTEYKESDGHTNWSTLKTQTYSTVMTQHTNVIDNKQETITKSCNCSKSSFFPNFVFLFLTTTTGLLLLLCLILIILLCILIPYYKKELRKLSAKGHKDTVVVNLHTTQEKVRFGQSRDQLVELTDNSFHDKSVYLQVLSEDGSIDDNLDTVVTSKSFPIVIDGVKGNDVRAFERGMDVSRVQPMKEFSDVMEGDMSSDFVAGMKFIDETFLL